MGRPKGSTHGQQQCHGCGKHVKNLRRHLAHTTCSNINPNTILPLPAIEQLNTDTPLIIGTQIGYQIQYNTHHTAPVSRNNSIYPKRIIPQNNSNDTSLFNDTPCHDNLSVSVLSVNTQEKEAGSEHKKLRLMNQNIKYTQLDTLNEEQNELQLNYEYTSDNNIDQSSDNSSMQIPEPKELTVGNQNSDNNLITKGNLVIKTDDTIYNRLVSEGFIAYTKIYDVFRRTQVPLYGYDLIIKTIGDEFVKKTIDPINPEFTRRTYLKLLCKKFTTAEPQVHTVHLESKWNDENHSQKRMARDTVEVITFDFKTQLNDLFSDQTIFGDMDNLVVNKNPNDSNSKWLPYNGNGTHIYEVLDGMWYQKHAKLQITDPTTQFLCPIGFYIDASETVVYQRYSFQPLIMFPLILSCKARNNKLSSRVIALIPDLEAKSSAVKLSNKQGGSRYKSVPIRNYHKCFNVGISSFKQCQKEGGFVTFLRLGNDIRQLLIKIPLAFVLGDAKSQDHLCGRFGGHNTSRMCRACHVSFQDSDDTTHKCKWVQHNQFIDTINVALNLDEINKNKRKHACEVLQEHSQHAVINSFDDVDFAGSKGGIFGATPHDLMHAFLEGILKYSTRLFINGFNTSLKAEIDLLVDEIFTDVRSSESKNMPRVNFTKGMTNLTMITADEEVGMALTLLIIGQTQKGKIIFDKRNNGTKEQILEDNELPSTQQFIEVIEILLSFHSWYKSEKPIKWNESHSIEQLLKSVTVLLNKVKFTLPREEGNGWKIQKFHELMHIPYDVNKFGSPKNFDTGIMENRLIHVGKINAKTTQKRGPKIFTRQLGDRIYQQQCFEKAKRCVIKDSEYNEIDDEESISSSDSTFSDVTMHIHKNPITYFVKNKPDYEVRINNMSRAIIKWMTSTPCVIPEMLLKHFEMFLPNNEIAILEVFTEIYHKNEIYRAHPNYRGFGAWFDWCMVKYDMSSIDYKRKQFNVKHNIQTAYPEGYYPAKILCFFKNDNEIKCIIHCCDYKNNSIDDSCLTEKWNLEYKKISSNNKNNRVQVSIPILRVCDLSSIEDRIFVIQETPGEQSILERNMSSSIILIKKKETWASYFTDTQ